MSHFGRSGPPDIRDTFSLLVLNISFRTTADDLHPLFDRYGKVVDVFIPRDRRTGDSRGFAFVRYKYADEAQKAVDRLDGRNVDGRNIMVQFAKYGPNAEPIRKGRVIEEVEKSGDRSRSRSPRPRDGHRDRDRKRRSHSRSRERHGRDRERDRRRHSPSRSLSSDYKNRRRTRDDHKRRSRSRSRSRSGSYHSASPARRGASPRKSPAPRRSPTPHSRSPAPCIRSPKQRSRSPAPHNRSPTPHSRSPTPPKSPLDGSSKEQTNGKGSPPSRSVSVSPQRASSRSPGSDGKVRMMFYCWLYGVAPLNIFKRLTLECKNLLSGVKLAVMPENRDCQNLAEHDGSSTELLFKLSVREMGCSLPLE
ncbi:hypothetical protein ACQ4PT_021536 [Festuca glaucescens]